MTTTIHDILGAFEEVAPLRLAEDFDNPGLLVGAYDYALRVEADGSSAPLNVD